MTSQRHWNTVRLGWLEVPSLCCCWKQDHRQRGMGTAEALSHHVWAASRGWGFLSSLDSLSHSALACS